VFEFNELEYYSPIPGSPTNEHRFNFWGYSTGARDAAVCACVHWGGGGGMFN
jgi:hypothetical protein